MVRMSVVFPQPEGPSSPVMVPGSRFRSRPWRISFPPRLTRRSEAATTGRFFPLPSRDPAGLFG